MGWDYSVRYPCLDTHSHSSIHRYCQTHTHTHISHTTVFTHAALILVSTCVAHTGNLLCVLCGKSQQSFNNSLRALLRQKVCKMEQKKVHLWFIGSIMLKKHVKVNDLSGLLWENKPPFNISWPMLYLLKTGYNLKYTANRDLHYMCHFVFDHVCFLSFSSPAVTVWSLRGSWHTCQRTAAWQWLLCGSFGDI